MDNKSNFYYPGDIADNSLNHCSSCNTQKKSTACSSHSHGFKNYNPGIYPQNYIQPAQQQEQNNQQQQQFYTQNYDGGNQNSGWQNNQWQNNQNNNQNNQWQNQNNQNNQWQNQNNQWQGQNWQADGQSNQTVYPQTQNQQKQKNMFGSLNPEQLMSLMNSKGNFASLLGNIGQSNPQLGMLLGMMQNMPKAKKQTKQNDDSPADKKPEKKYIKVKDYYKENPDE